MTPAAMTPAARAARKGPRAAARAGTIPARPAPSVPRRVSGPVRARPATTRPVEPGSRIGEFIRGLPDHPLLDRLVRGRAWIPLLGVMLAGIVAMQVEVLKLTASMGRSIALSSSLQSRNGVLRTSVSELSDAQRTERLATRMGMVMPGPTSINFLDGHVGAGQAAADIRPPDAAAFSSAPQASLSQTSPTTSPTSSTTLTSPATATTATTPTTAATSAPASSSTTATITPAATAPTGASSTAATSSALAPAATSAPSSSGGATAGP